MHEIIARSNWIEICDRLLADRLLMYPDVRVVYAVVHENRRVHSVVLHHDRDVVIRASEWSLHYDPIILINAAPQRLLKCDLRLFLLTGDSPPWADVLSLLWKNRIVVHCPLNFLRPIEASCTSELGWSLDPEFQVQMFQDRIVAGETLVLQCICREEDKWLYGLDTIHGVA